MLDNIRKDHRKLFSLSLVHYFTRYQEFMGKYAFINVSALYNVPTFYPSDSGAPGRWPGAQLSDQQAGWFGPFPTLYSSSFLSCRIRLPSPKDRVKTWNPLEGGHS